MSPEAFFALAERLNAGLTGGEVLFTSLDGEASDFVRINRGRVRQGGSVRSAGLGLTLIEGGRQAEAACDLTGDSEQDLARAGALVARLRERLAHLPEDPYLSYSTEAWSSDERTGEPPPAAQDAIAELLTLADGLDLVGIWASGEVAEGLASSLGHRHWHASRSFNLDWSCYLSGDRAVKSSYAGLRWDPAALPQRLARMRADLEILARPARTLTPGRYRAFLAPAAVAELTDMLAWGGFDLKGQRTRQTPLLKLMDGERSFDPRISIREEHDRGLMPRFTPEGFPKPPSVTLIEGGRMARPLVDARDGQEYGEPVNAASGAPESIALAAGRSRRRRDPEPPRHRALDRQPVVLQLVRPQRLPDHGHDPIRDLLGRGRRDRRPGRGHAIRRQPLPSARRPARRAHRRAGADPLAPDL